MNVRDPFRLPQLWLNPASVLSRSIALLCGGLYVAGAPAGASEQQLAAFNPNFFTDSSGWAPDLSRFERANPQDPGRYPLDLYLNQAWMGRVNIEIRNGLGEAGAPIYCFEPGHLKRLGVALDKLPPERAELVRGESCIEPLRVIPESTLTVDLAELRADLSVPQLYLYRRVRGYVAPVDWDSGVTASFVGYNANLFDSDSGGQHSRQYQASLNAGVNLAEWRLRHSGSYSHQEGDGQTARNRYDAISTYAQRDVTALKSQLTLGEYYTPADLFDSVPFTGAQLSSDDRMLPDSQRGFAPVIRGVAETNAKVSVYQGENLLYETTVAPGPFALDDLYNTGYAGDLSVTITEADGRIKRFLVPYASVAQLLRPGTSRFSISLGQYRDDNLDDAPRFVQGTYQRGLSNTWTGYTGSIIAERYLAVQGGVALSTALGALALDITQSKASGLPGGQDDNSRTMSGQSYRLTYSKLVEPSQTNFTVAAYRFSSEGYLSIGDYAQLSSGGPGDAVFRQRNRFQLNVTQPLGERGGNLYFSGSAQNYWNRDQVSDTTYQLGYTNGFNWGSFSLSASRTRSGTGEVTNQYMASISIPLGRSAHSAYLSTSLNLSDAGNHQLQSTLSGSAGSRNQLSYSVYGSRERFDGRTSENAGASARYDTPRAAFSGAVSSGDDWRQANLGVSGSLVAHPGGLTLTRSQGETLAVIEAKGAGGATVSNDVGAAIGENGYAVVSGLTPYRRNEVALDPAGASDEVELDITSQDVAPRAGAVVMLKYPTRRGKAVLLRFIRSDGKPVPLGAQVLDTQGNALAPVGQAGMAFLRGLPETGQLTVSWGQSPGQRCHTDYRLPVQPRTTSSTYPQLELACSVQREVLQLAGKR